MVKVKTTFYAGNNPASIAMRNTEVSVFSEKRIKPKTGQNHVVFSTTRF